MKIGIPKEIKNNENRVGMSPAGVNELYSLGHDVFVEFESGLGSGFSNQDYVEAGAKIFSTAKEVYDASDMIVKVKEPLEQEYKLIRAGQIVFTFFHFASSESLFTNMVKSKSICIAYETVENRQGGLPLLTPMSEVAGRMSIQEGAKYLEKSFGGKGILLGGVPGVRPSNVVIIGGGVVGTEAAKIAAGMGARVSILDVNLDRLKYLSEILPKNVTTIYSNEHNIKRLIVDADLIVGAVLIPGAKAPVLVNRTMLKEMQPGTVLIDVAVDQGGCIETCSPTSHEDPIYVIDNIVHYCVANMPGAVPFTSTVALNNATLSYIKQIAEKGWKKACQENRYLSKGLNIISGDIVHEKVAEVFGCPFVELQKKLNN